MGAPQQVQAGAGQALAACCVNIAGFFVGNFFVNYRIHPRPIPEKSRGLPRPGKLTVCDIENGHL